MEVDVGNDADDPPHKRSQRHSKTAFKSYSNDPTQLHFYPDRWQEVLTEAKMHWRFWMAMNWGFPTLREHVNEIKECLSSAITMYQEEGGLLDTGYYPRHKKSMIKLVWEDTPSFRGELKKAARELVRLQYNIFPRPPAKNERALTSEEFQAHVKDAVAALLHKGQFMQDGKDDNDRTNNLTHPAIAELCKAFFYGSTSKLGHAFSDEFETKVPSMAVALVITAIKCALDEWATGSFKRAPFQADTYSPVYKGIVGLIQKVVADEYHGSKFESAQRDWSASGSMRIDDQSKTGMTDLEVNLD